MILVTQNGTGMNHLKIINFDLPLFFSDLHLEPKDW